MWTCPNCGEPNEDHFRACWKCISDRLQQEATGTPEPPLPQVRSLGSVLFRMIMGFIVGTIFGTAFCQGRGMPLHDSTIIGLIVGAVICGLTGIFLWVLFPYVPTKSAETSEKPPDQAA